GPRLRHPRRHQAARGAVPGAPARARASARIAHQAARRRRATDQRGHPSRCGSDLARAAMGSTSGEPEEIRMGRGREPPPAELAWWRRLRPPRRLSFTREGRIIVILSIGVGFAAINTGNNLLYLLLGWLLSFIIASGVLSELTLRRLTVERRPPPRIFAGEPFLMEVVIKNGKPTRASYSIEVPDLHGSTPIDNPCYFLKIPEGRQQRTSYRHTFVRRGAHVLTGYRLATKFPFALFRKSRDVDAPHELLVYPARVTVPRPPPRAATRGDAMADRLGR